MKEPRVCEITWANGIDKFHYLGNGEPEMIVPTIEEAFDILYGVDGAKQCMAKRTYKKWRKQRHEKHQNQ